MLSWLAGASRRSRRRPRFRHARVRHARPLTAVSESRATTSCASPGLRCQRRKGRAQPVHTHKGIGKAETSCAHLQNVCSIPCTAPRRRNRAGSCTSYPIAIPWSGAYGTEERSAVRRAAGVCRAHVVEGAKPGRTLAQVVCIGFDSSSPPCRAGCYCTRARSSLACTS